MEFIAILYFVYMFIAIYFLLITLLLYFKNKDKLFFSPLMTRAYSISVLIPAYNEAKTIEKTIKALFAIDYPNIKEAIVINDGSRDNTLDIVKSLMPLYPNLKIINKKNSGKADSLNTALKFCKAELIVVLDADSYPAPDSFSKMVGFFDDARVGAVTLTCTPKNLDTFLGKIQAIEYKVIAFTRKLLEYIDSIYVVTGTSGMYRKKALEDIGGFDTTNITEDIEATWHLIHNGWKVKMAMNANIYTEVPTKIKPWYSQRRRWALGGLQCISKYKSSFLKKGMLGIFIVPFFTLGLFLGLIGIVLFLYLLLRRVLSSYLLTKYSLQIDVPIVTMDEFYITPSVLNYFGIVLFVLFLIFNFYVLSIMKDKLIKKQSFFNLLFYMTIYLLIYPIVLIASIKHYIKGRKIWGEKK